MWWSWQSRPGSFSNKPVYLGGLVRSHRKRGDQIIWAQLPNLAAEGVSASVGHANQRQCSPSVRPRKQNAVVS